MNKQTLLKLWIAHYQRISQHLATKALSINSTYLVEMLQTLEKFRLDTLPPFGATADQVYDARISVIRDAVIPQLEQLAAKFEIQLLGFNQQFLEQMETYENLERLNEAVEEYNVFMQDSLDGIAGQTPRSTLQAKIALALDKL